MVIKKDVNSLNTRKARVMFLCATFGIFGAHKFYEGKKRQGALFIFLDLTLVGFIISALWALINMVGYVIDEKNNEKEFIFGVLLFLLVLSGIAFSGGIYGQSSDISKIITSEVVDTNIEKKASVKQ